MKTVTYDVIENTKQALKELEASFNSLTEEDYKYMRNNPEVVELKIDEGLFIVRYKNGLRLKRVPE